MCRRCRGDNLVRSFRLDFHLLLCRWVLGGRRDLGGGLLLRNLVRVAIRLEAACVRFSHSTKRQEKRERDRYLSSLTSHHSRSHHLYKLMKIQILKCFAVTISSSNGFAPILYIYSSRLSQNYVKSWFCNGYLSDYSAVIATTSYPFTDHS